MHLTSMVASLRRRRGQCEGGSDQVWVPFRRPTLLRTALKCSQSYLDEGDAGHAAERDVEVIAVPLPQDVRAHAESALRTYCDLRASVFAHEDVRLEVVLRGEAATIYEHQFLSASDGGEDSGVWSRLTVAQFRFDARTRRWTLYYADRSSRWYLYDDSDPSGLEDLIAEVDADPTGIFWG